MLFNSAINMYFKFIFNGITLYTYYVSIYVINFGPFFLLLFINVCIQSDLLTENLYNHHIIITTVFYGISKLEVYQRRSRDNPGIQYIHANQSYFVREMLALINSRCEKISHKFKVFVCAPLCLSACSIQLHKKPL